MKDRRDPDYEPQMSIEEYEDAKALYIEEIFAEERETISTQEIF